jgi:hypothetical protein
MTQQLEHYRIQNSIESIAQTVSDSVIETSIKKAYLKRLSKLDFKMFKTIFQDTKVKITNKDIKYMICFIADMEEKDVSLIFDIELASVYTVRYRIRKKFAKNYALLAIL